MQTLPVAASSRPSRGFTLIELMIAIVVVAILAAVAFPSFLDSIRKGRRSEAFAALSALQQAQERWRGSNSAYTTALTDLGVASPTSSGYYDLTLSAPLATGATLSNGYIALAEGRSGTSQASDSQCRRVAVQVAGGNVTYCSGSCSSSAAFTATNPCWSR